MQINSRIPVLCIGSALWDIIASSSQDMKPGDDVAGIIRRRPGGVALNIALELVKCGQPAALLTSIGNDAQGDALIAELEAEGVDCRYVTRTDDPTDSYLAIEATSGVIFAAIADCASLEKTGNDILAPLRDGRLADPSNPWQGSAIIDGNLPVSVLESITANKDLENAQLTFVPASPGKAERLKTVLKAQSGTLFVNHVEAEILGEQSFNGSAQAAEKLRELGAERVIVTDGPNIASVSDSTGTVYVSPPNIEAKTTTGAGDVFLASFIAAEISTTATHHELMEIAVQAAAEHVMKEHK